ncbi:MULTISPECIES: outer membrane protein OmpK [Ferrimonas]|uniref:outer membrane protein OmpK n=1 Tax=Ferrimonas TaxID=44011 RepID=UPI0004167F9A|nr:MULTISPECIES: outer membrane protein OmpK [Ferrimonas]USD38470.1 ion channel protein Tsx [Ferrimonas sp. SCSIO 43195]
MMKVAIATTVLSAGLMTLPVAAEQFYGFMDLSINYLDWTDKAEDRTNPDIGGRGGPKEDFFYIELEGGAGFDWGDVYGFIDFENPTNSNDGQFSDEAFATDGFRIAAKGTLAYNLGSSNWNAYGHLYSFTESSSGFFDQNLVLGVSYDVFTDFGLWFKPFIGGHYEQQSFAGSGWNGGMLGWVLGYDFAIGEQKFSVTNWHETEFARDDQFRSNGTQYQLASVGWNGAVALWWHLPNNLTGGLQYRYADNKLGTAAYHDAIIYSLRYNF